MPSSLKNLNWALWVLSIAEAAAVAATVAIAGNFGWKAFGLTLLLNTAKANADFFREAKAKLEEK